MRFSSCLSPVALALAVLLAPASVRADDMEEARTKKDLGKKLFAEQRFEEALAALRESNRLAPSAAVMLTIADILQYLAKQEERAAAAFKKDPTEHERRQARADMLTRDAYNSIEQCERLVMTDGDRKDAASMREKLRPHIAGLEIATEPEGAEVFIDGQSAGLVRSVAVSPGEHSVAVKLAGHRAEETKVAAVNGASVPARFTQRRMLSPVSIQTRPTGAKVHVVGTGQLLGTTPIATTMPPGRLRISVTLDGHREQVKDLEIFEERDTSVELVLQPSASFLARLSVTGGPQGASVTLAGRPVGALPLSLSELDPASGRTRIEVALAGHEPWSDQVALEAGASTRVRVDLAPTKRKHWSGWKWIGYWGGSAALAGGVMVGLAARDERSSFFEAPSKDRLDTTNRLNLTADVLMGTGVVVLATTALVHFLTGDQLPSRAEVKIER